MKISSTLRSLRASYIREIMNAASSSDVISLAGGLPDDKCFPIDLLQEATLNLLNDSSLFQYGKTAGYAPLLTFLKCYYHLPETHEALISTGSQQGLDLIVRSYIESGDTVAVEAPSYLGALQVFELAQAKIITINQEVDGPNLTELERQFASGNVKLFYSVPDFHNPTGVCWSLEKRKEVARLCCEFNVTLIEDIPYRELRFSGESLPLVSGFCPMNSLVLRSFSKIATPGMRLGIVSGRKDWMQPLEKVKQSTDLHSSIPMQAMLLGLLKHSQFEEHLSKLCRLYQTRYKSLIQSLKKYLPEEYCHFQAVMGGMFVWVRFNSSQIDVVKVAQEALVNGVAVVPSSEFYPSHHKKTEPALRLNFTNADESSLEEAIFRLSRVVLSNLKKKVIL